MGRFTNRFSTVLASGCERAARLDDGVLRAEDGLPFCFGEDRQLLEGCETPVFAIPHADVLREVLIRCLLQGVLARGHRIPMLWHWPNNAPAAAMLTLECEEF